MGSSEQDLSFREESICNRKLREHPIEFIEWLLNTYCKLASERVHIITLKEYQHRMLDMKDF